MTMKKTIVMGSILAVFVLMITPCIPALQVQSNESSINKTLSQKKSLLFTDMDKAEDLESTISPVLKRLGRGLTDDGFQGEFNPLRKWLNRGWGLLLLFGCFTIYPIALISWALSWFIYDALIRLCGVPPGGMTTQEMTRMIIGTYSEAFLAAIQLLTLGIWPEDGDYIQKPPWIRW